MRQVPGEQLRVEVDAAAGGETEIGAVVSQRSHGPRPIRERVIEDGRGHRYRRA
jgi:hypothetical protein